jgi:predicted DNA-binding transcriptional regulator AlpA
MTNVDTQKTQGILEGYLRPEEMAQQIGVSTRTLARWQVHRIGPPRVVIGRQIFYRLASVLEWLESREQRRKK